MVAADKEIETYRVEIEHPSQACAIGIETAVHCRLEPFEGSDVYIPSHIVPSAALELREALAIEQGHR